MTTSPDSREPTTDQPAAVGDDVVEILEGVTQDKAGNVVIGAPTAVAFGVPPEADEEED